MHAIQASCCPNSEAEGEVAEISETLLTAHGSERERTSKLTVRIHGRWLDARTCEDRTAVDTQRDASVKTDEAGKRDRWPGPVGLGV